MMLTSLASQVNDLYKSV